MTARRPRRRAASRLTRRQLDTHHTHTTRKSIWIAALAALPPSILALATFFQALHLEQKVDGRLTQLLEVSRSEAAAAATINEKNKAAEINRQDDNKKPINHPATPFLYLQPKPANK